MDHTTEKQDRNGGGVMASTTSSKEHLALLMAWVDEEIKNGNLPRFSDVENYAFQLRGWKQYLKSKDIRRALRLHPTYGMNAAQQRSRNRARRYRPITTNTLGMLHADIGYFAKTREYETPLTYRAGYLVAKDVLSRYIYVAILQKNKSAKSLVRAFRDILLQHAKMFQGMKVDDDDDENTFSFNVEPINQHSIKSISFDRETAVVGKEVQAFLKAKNISFHAFAYSSSKSKFAESAIKQLRTTVARLRSSGSEKRWWHLLPRAVNILNNRPIVLSNGRRLKKWIPAKINNSNLQIFLRDLYKASPIHFFSQFPLDNRLVKFKFKIGSLVRPKLIVTSSELIGVKRSEIALESDLFQVVEQYAYLTAKYTQGIAYRCENLRTREIEVFDQDDVTESVNFNSVNQQSLNN